MTKIINQLMASRISITLVVPPDTKEPDLHYNGLVNQGTSKVITLRRMRDQLVFHCLMLV